jgi:DNA polymerase
MSLFDPPPEPPPIPSRLTLKALRDAAQDCRACELWQGTTQAVMGTWERPSPSGTARLMLIGEQPGDREDVEGKPFVGPAGRLLDQGLERAGIPRDQAYVTNVVKHFRYRAQGKRRIHQTPERAHVAACRPWLDAELELVRPRAVVLLGATAAQALLGSHIRVGRDRGRPMESGIAELVTLTTHPSAILRQRGEAERDDAMEAFVADLTEVGRWLDAH